MDEDLKPLLELLRGLRARTVVSDRGLCKQPSEFWHTNRIHAEVRRVAERLYEDGHYSQAVCEAYKVLDKRVSHLSKHGETGVKLMEYVFSPNQPKLRFSTFKGISAENEQNGYMRIYAGVMVGVRNPRAHEADHQDDRETCEDLLVMASHLFRKLDDVTRTRSRQRRRA